MQITLDGHPQYVRLAVGHREPAPGERQVQAEREFRSLLDRAAREPSGLRRLRALLCEVDTGVDRRSSSEEVVASMGRCITRGRVTLWAVPQPERFTDVTTAPAEDELEPLIQDPEPELSRVAFQVLEQLSGAPIGGVALSVTLPDGSVRELETDDDGLIDIRDIPPGMCEVRAERAGRHRADSVAFTGFGYFVPSNVRPVSGWERQGLQQLRPLDQVSTDVDDFSLLQVVEHRVRSGDTLASIAEAHGVTVDDITEFNWDTTDPAEIQRALGSEVGCSRRNLDTREFVFSDSDEPGVVLVPLPFECTERCTDTRHILQVKRLETQAPWVFSL